MAAVITFPRTDDWIRTAAQHAADELFPRSPVNGIHAAKIIEKHMRAAVALARKTV